MIKPTLELTDTLLRGLGRLCIDNAVTILVTALVITFSVTMYLWWILI